MKKDDFYNILIIIIVVFLFIVPIMLLPVIFHESWIKNLDNILNGSFAIIPATLIVVWQVHEENKVRRREEYENHKKEIQKIKEVHNDEIKRIIYDLLISSDEFPNLFSINYRSKVLTSATDNTLEGIIRSKENIKIFKTEFHQKSLVLQSSLVNLTDKKSQQEVVISIINYVNIIEISIKRLDSILNLQDLKIGLSYSEIEYEKVISNMCKLKKAIRKLPEELMLNTEFIDISTRVLDYYEYAIRCSKKFLDDKYKLLGKLNVILIEKSIPSQSISHLVKLHKKIEEFNSNTTPQVVVRDLLKIWALRNDDENRSYEYCVKNKIEIKEKKSKISNYVDFNSET